MQEFSDIGCMIFRASACGGPRAGDRTAPARAAPATAPARHDDSASTFGKPFYDFCVFPPSILCDRSKNRWYS